MGGQHGMTRTTLVVVTSLLMVTTAAGCGASPIQSIRQMMQPSLQQELRSAVVGRTDVLVTVSASGMIQPLAEADLVFEGSGRVAEVPIRIGDSVQAGELLARLDDQQLELQLSQAQANLASAEARLAQLRAGPQPPEVAAKEANLRAAEAQVSAAKAQLGQLLAGASAAQVAAVEADLASAQVQQETAQDMYDASTRCVTVQLPTGEEQTICPGLGTFEEQARYNLDAANKGFAAAQARLSELLEGSNRDAVRAAQANVAVVTAQRDASQAQLDLLMAGPTKGQVAAAEAQIAQAGVSVKRAQLALDRASLHAPFGGVVVEVNVTPGEAAPVGRPAVTIADVSGFRVTIAADELEVGQLAEGLAAQVTLDALPDARLTGTVARIAPAARAEGGLVYYDVVIDLAPTAGAVRSGMTANVTIIIEELTGVLTVPTWVVRVDRATNQTYVDRQIGDTTERVNVELGVRYEGVVQVISGLTEGDVVVLLSSALPFEVG